MGVGMIGFAAGKCSATKRLADEITS